MTLAIRPLPDAPFGAEVTGWDPGVGPGDELVGEIREALAGHVLLVLRGQRPPSDAELIRFAGAFGPLFDGGELFGITSPTREILRLTSERNDVGVETGPAASTPLPWHTDYSYLPCAAKDTFLEAVQLPGGGGGRTWFCNLYDAWETLPEARRAELDGLVGIHTIKGSGKHLDETHKAATRAHRDRRNPEFHYPGGRVPARHPVAHRHPDTGRTALYVNSLVAGFEGIEAEEARTLLDELMAHATRPERVYGHAWRPGDLIVFDDVGTMHRRDPSSPDEVRTMRQLSTMLAGDGLPNGSATASGGATAGAALAR
jgi:taurine dioxygenase/pentalenolactone F synthase